MVSASELRARARAQLGGNIFSSTWLLTLVAFVIVSVILSVGGSLVIIPLVLTGVLEFGIARILVSTARGKQNVNLGDLFCGFTEDFVQTFLLGLLTKVFVALWALLFVIPGIVKTYSYSMAAFIQQDSEDKNWQHCLDESRRMMDGHKMELFLLDLSFIGWYIVGAVLCGIGTLFVIPYHNQARANFYEVLCHGAQGAQFAGTAPAFGNSAKETAAPEQPFGSKVLGGDEGTNSSNNMDDLK